MKVFGGKNKTSDSGAPVAVPVVDSTPQLAESTQSKPAPGKKRIVILGVGVLVLSGALIGGIYAATTSKTEILPGISNPLKKTTDTQSATENKAKNNNSGSTEKTKEQKEHEQGVTTIYASPPPEAHQAAPTPTTSVGTATR